MCALHFTRRLNDHRREFRHNRWKYTVGAIWQSSTVQRDLFAQRVRDNDRTDTLFVIHNHRTRSTLIAGYDGRAARFYNNKIPFRWY